MIIIRENYITKKNKFSMTQRHTFLALKFIKDDKKKKFFVENFSR